MSFFIRNTKHIPLAPVIAAALLLRWALSIIIVIPVGPLGGLVALPGIASLLIIHQQQKHHDVPAPLLKAAEAADATVTAILGRLDKVIWFAAVLFGTHPAWPPGAILPQHRRTPAGEP